MRKSITMLGTVLATAVMVVSSAGAAQAKCADCSSGSGGGGIDVPPMCMYDGSCR